MGYICIGCDRTEIRTLVFTENVKANDKRSLLSVIAFLNRTAEVQLTLAIRAPGERYRQSKTVSVTRLPDPTLPNEQNKNFLSH